MRDMGSNLFTDDVILLIESLWFPFLLISLFRLFQEGNTSYCFQNQSLRSIGHSLLDFFMHNISLTSKDQNG